MEPDQVFDQFHNVLPGSFRETPKSYEYESTDASVLRDGVLRLFYFLQQRPSIRRKEPSRWLGPIGQSPITAYGWTVDDVVELWKILFTISNKFTFAHLNVLNDLLLRFHQSHPDRPESLHELPLSVARNNTLEFNTLPFALPVMLGKDLREFVQFFRKHVQDRGFLQLHGLSQQSSKLENLTVSPEREAAVRKYVENQIDAIPERVQRYRNLRAQMEMCVNQSTRDILVSNFFEPDAHEEFLTRLAADIARQVTRDTTIYLGKMTAFPAKFNERLYGSVYDTSLKQKERAVLSDTLARYAIDLLGTPVPDFTQPEFLAASICYIAASRIDSELFNDMRIAKDVVENYVHSGGEEVPPYSQLTIQDGNDEGETGKPPVLRYQSSSWPVPYYPHVLALFSDAVSTEHEA